MPYKKFKILKGNCNSYLFPESSSLTYKCVHENDN